MKNLDIKKKLVNNWFNYLQLEICQQFENLEKNFGTKTKKFIKRNWEKDITTVVVKVIMNIR